MNQNMKQFKAAEIKATGRKLTDPIGHSGYDASEPDKTSKNPDGSISIYHTEYSEFEVELECGHLAYVYSTGWLGGSIDCKQCDDNDARNTPNPRAV